MSDRALTIIILLVVFAAVGSLLYRAQMKEVQAVPEPEAPVNAEAPRSTQVKARMKECQPTQGRRFLGRGEITNIGNVDLRFVTVKVIWSNAAGLAVETNELFALNDEVLSPGESKFFTDTTSNTSARRCGVETVDWR